MTSLRLLVAALAACLTAGDSIAAGTWRFGRGADGEANASLFANNSLTTGSRAIDYHPVLTLSCNAGSASVWRQSIRVREPLSGSEGVDVGVRIDNAGAMRERWSLGQKNRAIVHDGSAGVARLAGARLLRVTWRVGLFSGNAEAVFSVAGTEDVIATLATTCGVAPPRR